MMQTKIHTFRAATMDEALDLVHRQLGQDFVIVESKEIAKPRFLPWSSLQQEVEVSAEQVTNRKPANQADSFNAQAAAGNRTIRTLAETMSNPAPPMTLLEPMAELPDETSEATCFSNEALFQPNDTGLSRTSENPIESQSDQNDLTVSGYRKSLESLQKIVLQLERQTQSSGKRDVPGELFQHYHKLIVADIEDEIARDLINKLSRQASADILGSEASVTAVLTALVEREMRCAPPIKPQAGRREIVMIVGPTGVGKTTTLAKLAAHYHLKQGLRVGLISFDTYRVGAVEQLQMYADMLELPLRTPSNLDELRIAIDNLDDVDLILIDTAGRNPFDQNKMNDLREINQVSGAQHVLLVLSMAAGPKMISRIADQFSNALPTSLVLTKLDELPNTGGLFSVTRDIPLPVSYLTTGQDVPDQIEPAHPTRMARLILGRDQINHSSDLPTELA